MGVPGLLQFLRENINFKYAFSEGKKPKEVGTDWDAIYVDFNAYAHVVLDKTTNPTCEKLCAEIGAYLEKLLQNCIGAPASDDPAALPATRKCLVYLAFDGVPCKAKMLAQRSRSRKEEDKWKNAIKPGTELMQKLAEYLKSDWRPKLGKQVEIQVSGTDEAGEGEDKIFQDLRRRRVQRAKLQLRQGAESTAVVERFRACVIGYDSDLVLLTIGACIGDIIPSDHLAEVPDSASRLPEDDLWMWYSASGSGTGAGPCLFSQSNFFERLRKILGYDGAHYSPHLQRELDAFIATDLLALSLLCGNDVLPGFPVDIAKLFEHYLERTRRILRSAQQSGSGEKDILVEFESEGRVVTDRPRPDSETDQVFRLVAIPSNGVLLELLEGAISWNLCDWLQATSVSDLLTSLARGGEEEEQDEDEAIHRKTDLVDRLKRTQGEICCAVPAADIEVFGVHYLRAYLWQVEVLINSGRPEIADVNDVGFAKTESLIDAESFIDFLGFFLQQAQDRVLPFKGPEYSKANAIHDLHPLTCCVMALPYEKVSQVVSPRTWDRIAKIIPHVGSVKRTEDQNFTEAGLQAALKRFNFLRYGSGLSATNFDSRIGELLTARDEYRRLRSDYSKNVGEAERRKLMAIDLNGLNNDIVAALK
ncbi:unnamed protein product [Amoebophrya sp. A120]|nr:unnamed protein product [Amoebophrya sp. A120]|eukprot:GSA120T00020260001.1